MGRGAHQTSQLCQPLNNIFPIQSRAAPLTRRLGRYRLTERLGGGGLAAVYRAVATDSGQLVAVKVLLSDADEVLRQRFGKKHAPTANCTIPTFFPFWR
jgi:hypothetical protein